jgi:arginase family enzyme
MPQVLVFQGRAGDHNDRGMAGAAVVGAALSGRLGVEPVVVGTPEPATGGSWETELPAALPALRALAAAHAGILAAGDVPVSALSRCAAGLATVPTVAARHPDARVVWLDAHGDLNTPAQSASGYLGGLVLSAAAGWWDSGLGAGLDPANVVLVGARDLDAAEQALVDDGTIALASGPDLLDVLDRHVGEHPVFVHLDCDVTEPGLLPTEFSVPGGLDLAALRAVAERLAQNPLAGLEIAEFEAQGDPADGEARAGALLDAITPLLDRAGRG